MNFIFNSVKTILFGPGTAAEIVSRTADYGTGVLLVTGRSSLKESGHLDNIIRSLKDRSVHVAIFDNVPPEPSLSTVEAGIELCWSAGCSSVAAVGGGSVLDTGKAIAALCTAPGTVREYFLGRQLKRKGLPFIAVPTTSGSGSEVTPNSVLIDTETKIKASIRSSLMFPDVAIVDPELTIASPRNVTAYSGMDALSQAIEAYISKGANPITDSLAERSVSLLINNLNDAYIDGGNIEYRTSVSLGSLLGGMAFSNARLGLIHGMAHPLGVISGLPHGLVCGILLPYIMKYNLPVAGIKFADLARSTVTAESGGSDESAATALIHRIEQMNDEMGISSRRSEIKPHKSYWREIIDQTLASGSTKSNPRAVTEDDVVSVLALL